MPPYDPTDPKDFLRGVVAFRELSDVARGLWVEKRKLADAVRRLNTAILRTGASADEIRELTRSIDTAVAHFETTDAADDSIPIDEIREHLGIPLADLPEPGDEEQPRRAAGMENMQERSPIVGHSNPVAPPLDLRLDVDAERVHCDVEFSLVYQGAPGCVHGGYVAAVFDEALGIACILSGRPAMTGELTTRYIRPTPILTPLQMTAKLDGVEGRKIMTSATLHAGDTLIARASGIFVTITHDRFTELKDQFEERERTSG